MLVSLKNISIGFGGPEVLSRADFQINENDRICLLGRNGSGKSTLLMIIHGSLTADSGDIIRQKGLTTGYLSQDIPVLAGSVKDIVAEGVSDSWKKIALIDKIITRLELDPSQNYEDLSVGLKRRTILARELVKEPDILLLDEPTNHLDVNSIIWLERFFSKYNKSLVFVTHDRAFLQKIANSIYELDRGLVRGWNCDYNTFLERREADLSAEEEENRLFDRKLALEEVWIRKGIKARRTRNEGRVRALKKLRTEREQRKELSGTTNFLLQQSILSGKQVIQAKDISFSYPDKKIMANFSTTIMRGDKIGILGQNGCGKSTLLKLLVKELSPQEGSVEHGVNLNIAYFDQTRLALDEDRSIIDNIAEGKDSVNFNGQQRHIFSYLQDFLFSKERMNTPVRNLSGGEKNRLLFAKLFTRPANVLVLDEPTNDLDQETLELLESLLVEFEGTVLIVSHDREFINNVVSSSIIFQPDGTLEEYIGGYENWRQKKDTLIKSSSPKKVRVKEKVRKLSFKEKQELADLPALIEKLEAEQSELLNIMSDPEFFKMDLDEIKKIQNRHAELDLILPEKYERWEELEAIQ
ncbi:MAG: ATP-binding cassette domain-containing protein [Candidatus Delongbacteria bacterium]|nr:ATP-binding cassette domain-containing protein [Candidatus Delongbacteria bacterium]